MIINNEIFINTNNLLRKTWGVTEKDLEKYDSQIKYAVQKIEILRNTGKGPEGSLVLFPHLPYLLEENVLISEEEKNALLSLKEKAKSYDAVISIGIGGSYLGNQVLFDLFCGPYWK